MEEQIERLRKDFHDDENKLRKQYEEECRLLEEHMEKEIAMEKTYMENCTEIEIGKLKEEVESKIDTLNKNRYQSLSTNETASDGENNEVMEKNRGRIDQELARDREIFEQQCKERRQRFEDQMKILLAAADQKRIETLKREIVPLVKANGMIRITDETLLETRYRLKFTRNAVKSGQSWALYRAQFQDKQVVCRVTVLSKIPNEIRMNLDHSTKCQRFLCEKQRQSDSNYFVQLHEIFSTEQKIYVIQNEFDSMTLLNVVQQQQQQQHQPRRQSSQRSATTIINYDEEDVRKWLRQLCDAMNFMHSMAIAHLNLRLDNIIFDERRNIRLIGLSRTFCYFNLDQEKFIKASRVSPSIFYDHLPAECFEGEFDPCRADVWSFGLLIYEMETHVNPRKQALTKDKSRASRTSLKKNIDRREFKNPTFDFDKIRNQSLRQSVRLMLDNQSACTRPTFSEIRSNEYFQSQQQ
ncbi:LOW QUALITY PROTEIN: uncharacterized protein LOC124490860 [Dermatophagoides farinae]|uniref:Kinase-like protein n=1 Tax=Dermatophagoides farinae TaxID=6954 RepID=A0A922I3Z5_DERFA|nr:testis-specific serine/threonine-protein kinase 4-like [Dermatophagoides farinae]KAH7639530.1 kinase-like protein [Dermatophagoides farinae]KAH9521794.1 protein serine threonine kinase [Dermatophagoides farinae]